MATFPFGEQFRCQYSWVTSEHPTVPLVDNGWMEIVDNNTVLFLNGSGYQYCSNGQLKKWQTVRAPTNSLYQAYVPLQKQCQYPPLEKDLVLETLRGKWIHMIGDSLTRDSYYDLLEYLGAQSACSREKVHMDIQTIHTLKADNSHKIYISLSFNAAKHPSCTHDDFYLSNVTGVTDHGERSFPAVPDFVIWSPGLWFRSPLRKSQRPNMRKRLACLGNASLQFPSTKFIFRTTTPYAEHSTKFQSEIDLIYSHNEEGIRILWHNYKWNLLDTWTMLRKRGDLSVDGGHYTGVGSKTITYLLLEMLVYNSTYAI